MNETSYIDCDPIDDTGFLRIIGEFVHFHRLRQNRTQAEVSNAADISRSTLSLLERGENVTMSTFSQVINVLGLQDIKSAFKVEEPVIPPIIVKTKPKRQRASKRTNQE